MLNTLLRALIAFVPVAALLVYSVVGLVRRRTPPALFQLLGAVCLQIVVFTHVAEGLRLLPAMRFGAPDSFGHYLDLSSALGGVVLLSGSVILRLLPRRNRRAT